MEVHCAFAKSTPNKIDRHNEDDICHTDVSTNSHIHTGHFRPKALVSNNTGIDEAKKDSEGKAIPSLGNLGAGKLIPTNVTPFE